jgi:hypothetical protein
VVIVPLSRLLQILIEHRPGGERLGRAAWSPATLIPLPATPLGESLPEMIAAGSGQLTCAWTCANLRARRVQPDRTLGHLGALGRIEEREISDRSLVAARVADRSDPIITLARQTQE